MPSIFDRQVKLYQSAFKKHGISPKSLKWYSYRSLALRYETLLKYLDINHKSILEIGSGFGDLIPFLQEQNKPFQYLGFDLVPEFIDYASRAYPDYNFQNFNILEKPFSKKFDLVISSGAFNHNVTNNLSYRKKAITALWDHATTAIAFNMAGSHPMPPNHPQNIVYYADSIEIFNFCTTLSPKVILDQSYSSKDFTIIMFKKTHS